MRLSDLGEFGLIDRIAQLTSVLQPSGAAGQVVLGIGDDAAVMEIPPGRQVVATIDTLFEEVHFRRVWTGPEDLGWKSLAVNVSDIAAMGAEPLAAFLSLALPAGTDVEWVEAFTRGLSECAQEYGCRLAGGDTVGAPTHLAITVALLGTVERGRAVLRSGARVGDTICVTGTVGDSAAGLALLSAEERGEGVEISRPEFAPLFAAHHRPRPRLRAARSLADTGQVSAMMDLSDGLASDIRHLVGRSGVGARIRRGALPVSRASHAAGEVLDADPTDWALQGGEDYELLFTVPPGALDPIRKTLSHGSVAMTAVGEIVQEGIWLEEVGGERRSLVPAGFSHF